MTDYDQENGPTLRDLANNKKVKLIVLAALAIAIGYMVYLDLTGQVGPWY